MATIRAVLKKEPRKTDGRHLVMLRLTRFRKAVYLGTGVYVTLKEWNTDWTLEKKNWVKKDCSLYKEYNLALKNEWDRLDALQLEHPAATVEQLKRLATRTSTDLLSFFREELARIRQQTRPASYATYASGFKQLEEYCKGSLSLDLHFVKRYEAHLLKELKRNTVSKYLAQLRTLARRAHEAGLLETNPFANYRLKAGKVHKDRLTAEEIAGFITLKLEGRAEFARRTFLVQFFLSGMRISDLLQLRWEQIKGDRLEYRSQKTGSLLSVKIPAPALELMGAPGEGYVFPFLEEGMKGEALKTRLDGAKVNINYHLKKIAKKLKIDKNLSTHVARHSFASLAWANSRDLKAVSQALGHTSVTMTENYLRELTHQEQDALSEATFKEFL